MLNAWMSRVLLLLSAVLAGPVTPVQPAQQPVRDGPVVETAFPSPMILTANFAANDQSLWGKGVWFTIDEHRQLSRFTCDGVSLMGDVDYSTKTTAPGLEFAARMRPDGAAEVKVRVAFWNPPHNRDKAVTVVVEVLDGSITVRRATVGPLNVEEGHAPQKGQTSFLFPLVLLREPLTLRLTITVTKGLERP